MSKALPLAAVPVDVPVPELGGLTVRQLSALLDQATSSLDTMAEICRFGVAYAPSHEAGVLMNTLQLLTERTGAMLDLSIGVSCGANVGRWLVGDVFHKNGDARSAAEKGLI